MRDATESGNRLSVDDSIDAIAREALEEARRTEEALRYRSNPGPIIAPEQPPVAGASLHSP